MVESVDCGLLRKDICEDVRGLKLGNHVIGMTGCHVKKREPMTTVCLHVN